MNVGNQSVTSSNEEVLLLYVILWNVVESEKAPLQM